MNPIKYNSWSLGTDLDSIDFEFNGVVVGSEFLSKIVDDWLRNNEEYTRK